MADEDEDLSHLRGPDPVDVDLSDETQDFRFLDKLTVHDTGTLTLPKRGEKDFEPHATTLQLDTLEASRQAMHSVLSWTRTHTQKGHIIGVYHAESNMAYVEKVKSQHFQTLGKARGKTMWLLPEEALFMIERGSMDCRWPAKRVNEEENESLGAEELAPMSLQAAYAAFIGFEGGVGGKLTLEMYTVYAGLKRSGYVVFRTGSWGDDRAELQLPDLKAHNGEATKGGYWTRFFSEIWRRLSQPSAPTVTASALQFGPLLKPGLYRSYADIYRLLQIIPTHDRRAPPTFMLLPDSSNPFRLTFDVYKSSTKFRKSERGPPDFRVAVINARETSMPTAAQLNDLLATVPYDPPNFPEHQMDRKLMHGSRNVILAVVDNGIPSFIRFADVPVSDERLYERADRAPRGKGGGARGRGRGRGGRGRGRGR
ncbi:tRNA splicing endonuclease-like protein subunit [Melanomma pulvis-pyrius CBS 109.77]|uniref:tRNA splicing endonuclease-like protein subunit n=1 Tax=Melanomma pulvis-pyrius CBS 109.77 TaxID=1314802 RepID=A0A6A6XSW5_9PLEO|nr:tRNA splicing endonuclease-like protein subunit [Melanomma pulvis-pyrius CBS 109.77]